VEGDSSPWLTVIGVVADVNDAPLGSEPNPHVYVPYQQFSRFELDMAKSISSPWGRQFQLVVASSTDPTALINPVLAEVRELDRSLPVSEVRTMRQIVGEGVAPQRASAALIVAFAVIALVLAGVGLYGVLAYAVTQRRREIGVRVALGASHGAIVRNVLLRGASIVAIGLVAGTALALAFTRVLEGSLYGVTPTDPTAFAAAVVALALVSLIAVYVPSRRAARVQPVEALRVE